jgi:hypothetical protein
VGVLLEELLVLLLLQRGGSSDSVKQEALAATSEAAVEVENILFLYFIQSLGDIPTGNALIVEGIRSFKHQPHVSHI